jgi:hypothetical protein
MSAHGFCNEELPFSPPEFAARSPSLLTIQLSQTPPITLITGLSKSFSGRLHGMF